jgi:DNA polymerase-1
MPPRFYIIDSHGQLYASYYAIRELTSPTGEPTNATYGFVATLLKILREEKPDYLAACFDLPGPTHRHELFEEYKAQRKPMPTDLIVQIERVREILGLMGIPQVESPGFEADDCIATLARQARAAGMEVVICSRDKDLEQLVGPGVTMLDTKTFERLDAEGIMKRRGVRPEQMQDVLALMGDASDNIPGVPGIGDKTAVKLVAQYGSLEGVLAHAAEIKGKLGERLRQHKEDALRSHELVRLEADVPLAVDLEACRTPASFDRRPLVALLRGLGFNKYVEEFQLEVASGGTGIKVHVVDTPAALAKLAKALAGQEAFAFDTETTSLSPYQAHLVGMSFAWAADEGYYVPLLGPEPQRRLSLEAVRKALGPVLAGAGHSEGGMPRPSLPGHAPGDNSCPREKRRGHATQGAARLLVGQNVKYDMLVCRRAGIELAEPLFDTMVAAYLSNPGRREYNLDALALDYFGFKKIPLESLLGKKRTERTMDQAPIDQVAEYSVEDAVITWRLKGELERELAEKGLADLARNVEMPLVPVLASMEEIGVAVDKGVLADIAANLDGRLAKLEKEIYAAAGHEFAINSPQQLAAILFEELGLRPLRRTAKGGRPSTDADVLEELAARHPLPRLVLGFRQLAKLKGTYVDALPALVEPETGRIHTSFNQTVTATGRLSSSDPNLQNIPIRTEEGRQVRRAFVPRPILTQGGMPSTLFAGHANAADAPHAHAKSGVGMPPESGGWLLLAADYSQIELRMLAHYSDDPALVRAFAEDRDIHTFVAHQIYGVPEAEVSADQRRAAKIVNFSLIYGKTAYGLSRDLGIGVTEAEQFIDGYFERYRGVRTFTADVLERAKKDGYVTTILGRRRYIEGIEQMDPKRLNFPERTAVNTVIQGSAADLIKVAMNRIWRRGRRENRPSRLLIQIHDELIFETPEASLAAEQQWIEAEMTRAMELKVPLRVHVATGRNWMEAE